METLVCEKCKQSRSSTLFALLDYDEKTRRKICRYCNYDGLYADEKDEILREAYRHWYELKEFFNDDDDGGKDIIEYYAPKSRDNPEEVELITISVVDLGTALQKVKLAPRKQEAFRLNVLDDMLQRDVAEIMGITTVSVGQYVKQAVIQLAEWYFAEDEERLLIEQEAERLALL